MKALYKSIGLLLGTLAFNTAQAASFDRYSDQELLDYDLSLNKCRRLAG